MIEVGEHDQRVAVVGPHVRLANGETQSSAFEFPALHMLLAANLGIHRVAPRLRGRLAHAEGWNSNRQSEVDWVLGAFMLIRREAFEEIGGFDREQWLYAEDLDLCWRLHQAGWTTVYTPSASVQHFGGAATSQAFGEASGSPQLLRAYYGWLRRRRGRLVMWAAALITVSGAIARLVLYSILSAFGSRDAADGKRRVRTWLRRNVAAARASRLETAGRE
jgi:GT2 family glycosyltransferase